MGEGAALFVLKRLADAERDGDRIYAVLLGIAGSSDGKGKGITAPNPAGQRLAIERAWRNAGVDPSTASVLEAHGTSTRVGDASELESLNAVFGGAGARARLDRARLGEVEHRPPEERRRRRRAVQDDHGAAREGAAAEPELPRPEPERRLGGLPVPGEHGASRVADAAVPACGAAASARSASAAPTSTPCSRSTSPAGTTSMTRGCPQELTCPRGRAAGCRRAAAARPASRRRRRRGRASRAGRVRATVKAPLRGALVVGGDSEADVAAQLARIRDRAAARRGAATAAARTRRWPEPGSGPPSTTTARPSWRTRRPWRVAGADQRDRRDAEDAARPRHLPWARPRAQGRLPLHRPGLAVRQHARRAARHGADRGADVRRGGPGDDAAARQAADRLHLHRPRRPGRGRPARAAAAADRDHPASRADRRHRPHPAARAPTASSPTW